MQKTALKRYPITKKIKGKSFSFRPLKADDQSALGAFFRTLAVDERKMLKDDVTDSKVIAGWCAKIDMSRVIPLLALDGRRIVGDATLHRSREGWSRHVANIRITIDPAYRRIGLAHALVDTLLDVAEPYGIAVVDAEIMSEQRGAISMFEDLGFVCVATLPQHAIDLNNQPHDLVVMSKVLIPVERLSPDMLRTSDEVDEGGG